VAIAMHCNLRPPDVVAAAYKISTQLGNAHEFLMIKHFFLESDTSAIFIGIVRFFSGVHYFPRKT